jgi:5-methylcytosine-specific restriction endonuclease McrA
VSKPVYTYAHVCEQCVHEFTSKHRDARFCSMDCFREHRFINVGLPNIMAGTASHTTLRKYLLNTIGVCQECGQDQIWNGKPLSLHMDHKDGNSDNNTLENVQLLCPHCHSQTDNFGVKNKGSSSRRSKYLREYRNGGSGEF